MPFQACALRESDQVSGGDSIVFQDRADGKVSAHIYKDAQMANSCGGSTEIPIA